MALYDNNGTTNAEIGTLYDNNGTTNYQIGSVYDHNGTTNSLIYTAEKIIYQSGTVYEGGSFTGVSGSYDAGSGYTVNIVNNTTYASTANSKLYVFGQNLWGNYSNCGRLFTTSKVDFTGFTTLHFQASWAGQYYWKYFGFNTSSRSAEGACGMTAKAGKTTDGSGELTVALSGTSGYIGLSVDGQSYNNNGSLTVTKIWLT